MQSGTIVILNDVIGAVQNTGGDWCELLCSDGNIRRLKGDMTEVVNPHALALLTYKKLLERIKS